MSTQQDMERRIDLSSEASLQVYNYEQTYTELQEKYKDRILKNEKGIQEQIQKEAIKAANKFDNATIIDAAYDPETGVAGIAVKDKVTNETYIAYAGTDYEADTYKDIRSDAAIGLNDVLYLKKNAQPALDFYEKIERRGENITVLTGHSYGEHLAGRVSIEKQVPFNLGYQGAPQSVNGATAQELAMSGKSPLMNIAKSAKNFDEFKTKIKEYYKKAIDSATPPLSAATPAGIGSTSLAKLLGGYLIDKVNIPLPDEDLQAYWDYLRQFKDVTPADVQAAKAENERVQQLLKDYKGYSVTFSTTRDALTNIVWAQGRGEISFGGQVLGEKWQELALDTATPFLLNYLGMTMKTKYPGKIYVLDREIEHNMIAIINDPEALTYAKQQVLSDLYNVDIDGDGTFDFTVSPLQTTPRNLYPTWAKTGSGTIDLNTEALLQLKQNLARQLADVLAVEAISKQSLASVEAVIASHGNRRTTLKEAIVSHLEQISLIQAIKDIDKAYHSLDDSAGDVRSLGNYDPFDFSRKFDWFGISGFYRWLQENNADWAPAPVTKKLDNMTIAMKKLEGDIELNSSEGADNVTAFFGLVNIGAKTRLAQKGENLINSFEGMIDKSTQGLDNRSHYVDGIPQALAEILKVEIQNIQTIVQCNHYLQATIGLLVATMSEQDQQIATGISNFDTSSIAPVQVSKTQDYNTYLEESGIFDDRNVVAAFDNQVDVKASELASAMSQSFTNYLNDVHALISSTNACLNSAKNAISAVKGEFPTAIYYEVKVPDVLTSPNSDIISAKMRSKKEKHYYGTVKSNISVAGTVDKTDPDLTRIDKELTTASTTINNTLAATGSFYDVFRQYMEEAIYGVEGLSAVVRAQKGVSMVLATTTVEFNTLLSQLQAFQGTAVDALSEKVADTSTLSGHVTNLIGDCFGDE